MPTNHERKLYADAAERISNMALLPYPPADTSPEVFELQRDRFKEMSSSERFGLIGNWSRFVKENAKNGIRQQHPQWDEGDVAVELIARCHGRAFVESLPPEAIKKIRTSAT